jgi:hypothetical protein
LGVDCDGLDLRGGRGQLQSRGENQQECANHAAHDRPLEGEASQPFQPAPRRSACMASILSFH